MIKTILEKYPCDGDCRFQTGLSSTTLMYYPPIYDKDGINTNPDRNITYTDVYCTVCFKKFSVSEQLGEFDVRIVE